MIYLVDPPPQTPRGWMSVSDDQHRRLTPPTAGLSGEQDHHDWLAPLRRLTAIVVRQIRRVVARDLTPSGAQLWVRRQQVVHRVMRHA